VVVVAAVVEVVVAIVFVVGVVVRLFVRCRRCLPSLSSVIVVNAIVNAVVVVEVVAVSNCCCCRTSEVISIDTFNEQTTPTPLLAVGVVNVGFKLSSSKWPSSCRHRSQCCRSLVANIFVLLVIVFRSN